MKTCIMTLFSCVLLFVKCSHMKDTTEICGQKFKQEEKKVFLTDENIESTMVQIIDKQTNKFVFGYYKDAIRNDTNYIYSRINSVADTIIRRTYHDYKITDGVDSTVSTFICSKNGMIFHTHKTYWNGTLTQDETKDVLIGQ